MNTKCMKTDWLMPLVGIAVVAAGILAARTYIGTERKTQDVLAFDIMLERLSQELQLSMALMEIHRGKAEEAAQRLDLLLCRNILRTDSELAFTDGRAGFRRFDPAVRG